MLVVVGGHSRNIGKTSVMAGIIAALRERDWTAIKITQHGHGICSEVGEPCECSTEYDHPYAISEETNPRNRSDSARFLLAGAKRAYWLRTGMGQLGHALPVLRELVNSSGNTIVESNSLLQFWKPDLYLVVLDFSVADFKESTRRYLDRADALVVVHPEAKPAWRGVSPALWQSKPRFAVSPPNYVSLELAAYIADKGIAVPKLGDLDQSCGVS
ncbi:MAG: hypothetical protein HYR60_21285 [Acidobacteria bacterium]|nr:hypothetical protein [Acidobacteriota bacterium]MBI3473840.1 hypothetical protein [Candidatus Solibacter usitatus]